MADDGWPMADDGWPMTDGGFADMIEGLRMDDCPEDSAIRNPKSAMESIRHPTSAIGNPWKTLDQRLIYENPWISVREDRVIRPDGQPGIYGVVHYKNRAIGVLPVDENGGIWLVGQYRYTLDLYSWEIPEGGGPLDESPEETALRELREETGLIAGHLEFLGNVHLSNSVTDEIGYLYRATQLTPGPSAPEGTERLQVRRVEWPEAWAMLQRGEITDSLSVIALLHEAVHRQQTC